MVNWSLYNLFQMQYPARIRVILDMLDMFGVIAHLDGEVSFGIGM